MLMNPRFMYFFSMLLLSLMIVISSNSWFSAWIGLELNILSFIPILMTKNNQQLTEASLKYFLTQALASIVFIFSALFSLTFSSPFIIMLMMSLLLKLGSSPFHMWFPVVAEGLSWNKFLILATVQKISPLLLLTFISFTYTKIILTAALLSGITGGVGGFNLNLLRSMMAFSSINHMGWLLLALIINNSMMWIYFGIYIIILSSIVQMFSYYQLTSVPQINSSLSLNPMIKLICFMNMFSLSGLPPFLGFVPKWLIIKNASAMMMIITLMGLIVSTLITLYYYMRISFNSNLLYSKSMWNKKLNFKMNIFNIFLSSVSIFGMFLCNWIYFL
uniref:NADH-ubiquinone oxidoreductase chain 2 n=1 Tax=Lepidurus apus lubbocki TaxID=217954 RepID=A0A5B7XTY1_9CRUS|nr:NADH dehydrogenase subunit 2 [Lepidurus apus lubbocki]QCZ36049.1 NADH dehydrogenase subunit 2 [Lepidurus apus lubbocki]